jgi:hypothetical protein
MFVDVPSVSWSGLMMSVGILIALKVFAESYVLPAWNVCQ